MNIQNLRKRKNHFLSKREQQRQNLLEIKRMISTHSSFLDSLGLEFKDVTLQKKTIAINAENNQINDFKLSIFEKKEGEPIEMNLAYKFLKTKDCLSMSRKKFFKMNDILRDKNNKKVSFYSVNKIQKSMDLMFSLNKIQLENSYGFYFRVEQKLNYFITKFIEKNPDLIIKNNNIMIKFSGDATNVTKTNLKQLNFTFTILNDAN